MFTKILNHIIETYNARIHWVDTTTHIVLRTDRVSISVRAWDSNDITISLVLIEDHEAGHYASEWTIYDNMWFDSDNGPVKRSCTYDDYVAFIKEYFEMRI